MQKAVQARPSGHGACWFGRRVRDRYPALSPPFTAMSRALRLDIGGIDGCAFGDRTSASQSFEQTRPETPAGPAVEPVVNRCRGTVCRWAIAPAAAGLENVNDARDDAPIIDTPRAGLVLGKMRLYRRPLRIAQPEKLAHQHLQKIL